MAFIENWEEFWRELIVFVCKKGKVYTYRVHFWILPRRGKIFHGQDFLLQGGQNL